jgi:phosphatidylglycerol:prolipoprotein diacylglycerol transferase
MTWTYPALMVLAIVTGALLSRRSQRSLGLETRERIAIALGAFCGGMIGAKLPFVLADPQGLMSGRVWFENGKTIVFGLVGGYFGVEVVKRSMEIRVKTGDSFAVPVAAAISIGRLACFVGGCCFGSTTSLPWGVDFGDGLKRHPTQLYEFVFHLTAVFLLAWLRAHGWFRGQLIKLYIITYLIYRVLSEFIRPEPRLWMGFTGYQWAAAVLIPVFGLLWWKDARDLSPIDFRHRLPSQGVDCAEVVTAGPEREQPAKSDQRQSQTI